MLHANEKIDITQHEIAALQTRFNLADAHTHQPQSQSQRKIVESLPALWDLAENRSQKQSEQEFIEAFYRFHGQLAALERRDEIYLLYAASIGLHITATYLRQRGLTIGLIEPCFDNLRDLMRHMQLPISPIDEEVFATPHLVYENLVAHAGGIDAILVVDPNNPTGFSMCLDDAGGLRELIRFCVDHGKILILDFSFAAFIKSSGKERRDVYRLLEDSGVDYIAIEDTGKIWPMQDAKCATIMASRSLNADIYAIVTSVLLNVSPFLLQLVTRYIKDSEEDGFASVHDLLDGNRRYAIEQLDGTHLRYCAPVVDTSVVWFEITAAGLSADDMQAMLLEEEVYVVSGRYFYWHQPERGHKFIRLALTREPELFRQAVTVMRDTLLRRLGPAPARERALAE